MNDWNIKGTYYETCNCEAICPCRQQDGAPGGNSTYGDCQFLLSWIINEGAGGETDLSGVKAAMAGRYSDNEEGKLWTVILYVDRSATDEQFQIVSDIFLGRAGGDIAFTQAIANIAGVRKADIKLDHTEGRQIIQVDQVASAVVVEPVDHQFTVSCGIPGHDKPGRELISDSRVEDGPFDWSYRGRCGFSTWFRYQG